MPVVAPPQIIGIHDASRILGLTDHSLRWYMKRGQDGPWLNGYIGKIGGRHCWNAHSLILGLYGDEASLEAVLAALEQPAGGSLQTWCAAPDCERSAVFAALCRVHLRRMLRAWSRAERSRGRLAVFVQMCRWVVERHRHLVLPEFDPWSPVCYADGCDNRCEGPYCADHMRDFWADPPEGMPGHWWNIKPKGRHGQVEAA